MITCQLAFELLHLVLEFPILALKLFPLARQLTLYLLHSEAAFGDDAPVHGDRGGGADLGPLAVMLRRRGARRQRGMGLVPFVSG